MKQAPAPQLAVDMLLEHFVLYVGFYVALRKFMADPQLDGGVGDRDPCFKDFEHLLHSVLQVLCDMHGRNLQEVGIFKSLNRQTIDKSFLARQELVLILCEHQVDLQRMVRKNVKLVVNHLVVLVFK